MVHPTSKNLKPQETQSSSSNTWNITPQVLLVPCNFNHQGKWTPKAAAKPSRISLFGLFLPRSAITSSSSSPCPLSLCTPRPTSHPPTWPGSSCPDGAPFSPRPDSAACAQAAPSLLPLPGRGAASPEHRRALLWTQPLPPPLAFLISLLPDPGLHSAPSPALRIVPQPGFHGRAPSTPHSRVPKHLPLPFSSQKHGAQFVPLCPPLPLPFLSPEQRCFHPLPAALLRILPSSRLWTFDGFQDCFPPLPPPSPSTLQATSFTLGRNHALHAGVHLFSPPSLPPHQIHKNPCLPDMLKKSQEHNQFNRFKTELLP